MIQSKLLEEIEQYCKANNIEDIEKFVNKMLRNGFNIEKYGEKPPWFDSKPKEEVKTIAEELIPVQELERPTGVSILSSMDIIEEKPSEIEVEPEKEETSKTYNINIKVNNDKRPDLYDEDSQPSRGFLGPNIFNRKRNE